MKKSLMVFSVIAAMLGSMLFASTAQATGIEDNLMYYNPKVIVTSYEIEEGVVAKGEEFTLNVEVTNMNEFSTAYNATISLTSTDYIYIAEGNSNVVYFDTIKAGESVSFSMKLGVMENVMTETVVLTFTSLYNDELGNEYGVESAITPKLADKVKMEIPAISVANKAVVGAKALVSVRYSNTGDTPISKIRMNIEGNVHEEQKNVDLGDLDADEQKYLDYYVTFNQQGDQSLNISFEYEDEKGNIYTIDEKEYSLVVYSYTETGDESGVIGTEKLPLGEKEIYMLIAGGATVAIILVVMIVMLSLNMRKKAMKKEQR
ncbi:MAG: hypothetical protein IJY10_05680 [Lachnospiraceae bacterium]|nr:hypothetical protein [Lachnospiraceae bacterium]